ncbi:MAG: DUF4185 domain-containing protein [Candidatus Thorarchaeota archaeon]|nr:DUF4185 domain-containing protein [Candidatus Thorarchaeota archaeon]
MLVCLIAFMIVFAGVILYYYTHRPIHLNATVVSQLTGQDALNNTQTVDVNGTDLGIVFDHQGMLYYMFGDTFGCGTGFALNWRSNTLAYSTDTDPSDGIMLKGWIIQPRSTYAKELIGSLKQDNVEMTSIPTAVYSDNHTIYVYYMSVKHWSSTGGMWTCNNASIAYSTDNGQNFVKAGNISWPGDSNFVQFGVAQGAPSDQLISSGDYIYLLATGSGRFKGAYLMRAPRNALLNQLGYSYFAGLNSSGGPTWTSDMTQAQLVLQKPVGELSVMWNSYLNKWTVWYTNNVAFAITLRTADNLWGPWSDPVIVADAKTYPGLYGSYVHPSLVEKSGSVVYFIMSRWSVYNTFVMRVDLSPIGPPVRATTLSPQMYAIPRSQFRDLFFASTLRL